jgi:hypothetical protein
MQPKRSFLFAAFVVLALVGCGSTKKAVSAAPANTASTSATLPPGTTTLTAPPPPATPRTYQVKLSGAAEIPAGAPNGSGIAVISIKAGGELCWKFSGLKNVTAPTVSHIHRGLPGSSGPVVIPLGGAYKATGCVHGAATPLLALIEASPQRFYVNIHNAQYPGGAVRAQL